MKLSLQSLQPLGRALMLPIAVLPIAGLLLRLGQPDLLDLPFVAAAGAAIFENLGMLFALGIAVGIARDANGAAGLAGLVCFLVASKGAETLLVVPHDVTVGLAADAWRAKSIAKLAVPIGIASGLTAGAFYNRYGAIRLPEYLAFFGGRRFVPILSGLAGLLLAAVVGYGFAPITGGMDMVSGGVVHAGVLGLFAYGVLNRMLIVTGLHHVLNNVAWFIIGDFHGTTGDLNRFFAGDPAAGSFMSGFFPVMMFGLPAACLAMYHAARPERRKAVGGMFLSMALTAFLTGVTEPIEFTFMFLAPLLYAMHVVMTGVAMALMDLLGVKLGFGFSAGLLDYVLNYSKATHPLLLLPVGTAYALLYYASFRWAIARFDIRTPGREDEPVGEDPGAITAAEGARGAAFVAALGGKGNLAEIGACTTRLRLRLHDSDAVDEPRLRALGARGLIRPAPGALQVVVGPIADDVASEMREAAGALREAAEAAAVQDKLAAAAVAAAAAAAGLDAVPWLAALGGRGNVLAAGAASSRVWVDLADAAAIDEAALKRLGARMVLRGAGGVQLIVGPWAPELATGLSKAA